MIVRFLIVVLDHSQSEKLLSTLRSLNKLGKGTARPKIHLMYKKSLSKVIQQKTRPYGSLLSMFPLTRKVSPLRALRFHIEGRKDNMIWVLVEPGFIFKAGAWNKLFSIHLNSQKWLEPLIVLNTCKKDEMLSLYNSMFHCHYALIIRKIDILADESKSDPTNGWVLPYHSLMLDQQLLGTAKIVRGEYFIYEKVKRSEGEWSVWKAMLQRRFANLLPDYRTLFHNSRKIVSKINETPCTSQSVPIITVLMSVYNEKHFLNDCLSSLAYQTIGHFQTVIIDDASTDGSYELLKKWEYRIPGCTILRQATNEGKGKSMNLGLQHVTTPYVLEMDGDDWLDPDAIEVLERRISTLQPNTVYVYGDRRKFRADDYGKYHEFTGIYRGRKWSGAKVFALDKKTYGPRIYRTAVLKENGGWPTASGMGNSGRLFEDFLLALQLLNRGAFVYWDGTPVYNIRIHRNSESVSHLHERDKWLNPYIYQLIKNEKNRSIRKE